MLGETFCHLKGGMLLDERGQPLALRAKSVLFLKTLLESNGRILSKSELADKVWPGMAVTDESISQCVADIRRILGDETRAVLETFPKQGYRINARIVRNSEPTSKARKLALLAASLGLAIAVVIGVLVFERRTDAPTVLREVIAVFPLREEGGSEEQYYFASQFAEELNVRLTGLSGFSVVPSSESFSVGDPADLATSRAKALGARYAVDGKVRYAGQQFWIAVELIDVRENKALWAGKFEGSPDQLMQVRDQITREIADAVFTTLAPFDRSRIESYETVNLLAYEEVLRGRRVAASFSREESQLAERHFRHAIELDPTYARAYAELAALYAIRFENGWTVLSEADEIKSLYFANLALELDPELWLAHYALGRLHTVFGEKNYELAEHHLELAMALQPANDDARVYYGAVKNFQGEAEFAVEILEQAISSHPSPPFWYYLSLGHALFQAKRHEEAAVALEKCLYQMPSAPYCLRFQIANFGALGLEDDAGWTIEEYELLGFDASVSSIMDLFVLQDPTALARLETALRATGMPER